MKHETLEGKTPAEKVGINVKGWKELIENAQVHNTNKDLPNQKIETMEVKSK